MKKVLIIVPSLKYGGAERQIVNDAILLSENNFDVCIAYKIEGALVDQIPANIEKLYLNNSGILKSAVNIYKNPFFKKADFVFAHIFWSQKVAFLLSLFSGKRYFFFDHGLGLWKKWYHIFITRIISLKANKIITVSKAKKNLKHKNEKIPLKKIQVIPNSFSPTNNTKKEKAERKNELVTIGFVGRFMEVKQLHVLVDVCKEIRLKTEKFKFLLVGDGISMDKIKNLIELYGLESYFEFTGYVENPKHYFTIMDIFVLPSKREDLSVALLEASSTGLPSVAFDVGGNKEIIINGKTGFIIPPYDIKKFTDRLLFLMENTEIRSKMGIKAASYVQKQFSEDKRVEKLIKLIGNEY